MKKIFTFLLFCTLLQFTYAQEAPDFTVTTTHNEEFNLYSQLDAGKTIVLDLFFVNCPPCNDIAPRLQQLNLEWGDGSGDVIFISLSDRDLAAAVKGFEEMHGLTFPAAGTDGGSADAVKPYSDGNFGQFFGFPTLVVVAPNKAVTYDVWGESYDQTIQLLDEAIEATGATKSSQTFETDKVANLSVYPNPVVNDLNISLDITKATNLTVEIADAQGRLIQSIDKGQANAGSQNISVDMSELANGTYFVSLLAQDGILASFNVVK